MIKPLQPDFVRRKRENYTTALRAWEMHPSAACGGVSPRGGDFSGAMLLSYVAHCLVPIVPPSGVAKELGKR